MWVAMSDPWTLYKSRLSSGRWCVSMWCLCQRRSPSFSGAVGHIMAKGNLSLSVFRVRVMKSQLILGQQSTSRPPSTMETGRQFYASMGVGFCSRKIPTKGAGRYMVFWTRRGSTSASVKERVPRRSVPSLLPAPCLWLGLWGCGTCI